VALAAVVQMSMFVTVAARTAMVAVTVHALMKETESVAIQGTATEGAAAVVTVIAKETAVHVQGIETVSVEGVAAVIANAAAVVAAARAVTVKDGAADMKTQMVLVYPRLRMSHLMMATTVCMSSRRWARRRTKNHTLKASTKKLQKPTTTFYIHYKRALSPTTQFILCCYKCRDFS